MPQVISYTRFSSPKQAKGDSYRRQMDMAHKWCLKNGLTLDTDFVLSDLGISGFTGANAKRGALGVLQKLCLEEKIVPGTVLLIEAFDRLTRLSLPEAYELLLSLVNNGLTIVTLTDEKVWTKNKLKNLEAFMLSLVTLYRGYDESSQKSDRLRKTFSAHRAASSRQAFGSAPGWLYRENKNSVWQVNEVLAKVVSQVFELSSCGLGSKSIAGIANQESWPVPTRLNKTEGRWHAQMPGMLLRNRAVLGEHEYRIRTFEANNKHWQGASTGQRVSDFYPRIISDDLFYRARASIETRSVSKRRDIHFYNIWSGLVYCGHCGAPVQRKNEKDGYSRAQLQCSDRLAGLTNCKSFSAKDFDSRVLGYVAQHSSEHLNTTTGDARIQTVGKLEFQFNEKTKESNRIAEAIARTSGSIDALLNLAIKIEEQLRSIAFDLNIERQGIALAETESGFDAAFYNHCMSHLYNTDPESRIVRASIHLKIARLVKTIWVWGYDVAIVEFKDSVFNHVPLPGKTLPSRANPNSKHHKPPKLKDQPRPFLMQALNGELFPPLARRRNIRKPNEKILHFSEEPSSEIEVTPWEE